MNEQVHAVFDEGQVYRIDHYLGKETVQNILAFRAEKVLAEEGHTWHIGCGGHGLRSTASEAVLAEGSDT